MGETGHLSSNAVGPEQLPPYQAFITVALFTFNTLVPCK